MQSVLKASSCRVTFHSQFLPRSLHFFAPSGFYFPSSFFLRLPLALCAHNSLKLNQRARG